MDSSDTDTRKRSHPSLRFYTYDLRGRDDPFVVFKLNRDNNEDTSRCIPTDMTTQKELQGMFVSENEGNTNNTLKKLML